MGVILFALLVSNFGQFHKTYHACKKENFSSKACEMHKKVKELSEKK